MAIHRFAIALKRERNDDEIVLRQGRAAVSPVNECDLAIEKRSRDVDVDRDIIHVARIGRVETLHRIKDTREFDVLAQIRQRHDLNVLIALDDIEFRDEKHDGDRDVRLKSGEALWYAGNVVHRLKSLDKQDARLVTLEFK